MRLSLIFDPVVFFFFFCSLPLSKSSQQIRQMEDSSNLSTHFFHSPVTQPLLCFCASFYTVFIFLKLKYKSGNVSLRVSILNSLGARMFKSQLAPINLGIKSNPHWFCNVYKQIFIYTLDLIAIRDQVFKGY